MATFFKGKIKGALKDKDSLKGFSFHFWFAGRTSFRKFALRKMFSQIIWENFKNLSKLGF